MLTHHYHLNWITKIPFFRIQLLRMFTLSKDIDFRCPYLYWVPRCCLKTVCAVVIKTSILALELMIVHLFIVDGQYSFAIAMLIKKKRFQCCQTLRYYAIKMINMHKNNFRNNTVKSKTDNTR